MDTLSYKTISANKATVTKEWVIVDATDQTLGRLGAKVAKLLRGKYKPNFTPHVDCGDNVIIINADKVKLTDYSAFKVKRLKSTIFSSGSAAANTSLTVFLASMISS